MTLTNRTSLSIFCLFSFVVMVFGFWLSGSRHFYENPDILSLALTIDIVIVLPLLYYFTAKKLSLPLISVLPVFILTLVYAGFIIPDDHHYYLDIVKLLLAPVEAGVIGYLIYKVRQVILQYRRQGTGGIDFVETLTGSIAKSIGIARIAGIFATEISIFYYGIFAWRAKPEAAPGSKQFTCYKERGYPAIASVIAFVIIAEAAILHLFIMRWSAVAALILDILSVYGLLFILADLNAMRKRPIYIAGSEIDVRTGFRWRVKIPAETIENIELVKLPGKSGKNVLDAAVIGGSNCVITLNRKLSAVGLYGIRRSIDTIALSIDDSHGFVADCRELMV